MANTLRAEERLTAGQSLVSTNGEFELSMQVDGNLVLYHRSTGRAMWWTDTTGLSVAAAVMQRDGNLVLYGHNNEVRWASRTTNYPGSETPVRRDPAPYLILDDDGRVLIFAVIGQPRFPGPLAFI